MQLNDKVYSTLKWVVQIFMPALITLYTGLASAWDWDHVVPTTTTLAAVTTFLGVLLGLSSASFKSTNVAKAGTVQQVGVDPDTGMAHMAVKFAGEPGALSAGKQTLTFEVVPPPPDMQN